MLDTLFYCVVWLPAPRRTLPSFCLPSESWPLSPTLPPPCPLFRHPSPPLTAFPVSPLQEKLPCSEPLATGPQFSSYSHDASFSVILLRDSCPLPAVNSWGQRLCSTRCAQDPTCKLSQNRCLRNIYSMNKYNDQ